MRRRTSQPEPQQGCWISFREFTQVWEVVLLQILFCSVGWVLDRFQQSFYLFVVSSFSVTYADSEPSHNLFTTSYFTEKIETTGTKFFNSVTSSWETNLHLHLPSHILSLVPFCSSNPYMMTPSAFPTGSYLSTYNYNHGPRSDFSYEPPYGPSSLFFTSQSNVCPQILISNFIHDTFNLASACPTPPNSNSW